MKRSVSNFIVCLFIALLAIGGMPAPQASAVGEKTPVSINGQLSIKGTQLINQDGKAVQLKESVHTDCNGMVILSIKTP